MNGNGTRRNKRANNACQRCRRRKIRCSGIQPCNNCSRRNYNCQFDEEGKKVIVSQRYLQQLRTAAAVQDSPESRPSRHEATKSTADHFAGVSNPLSDGTSSYVIDDKGRLRCLGTSSTWSFSRKTLFLIRNYLGDPSVSPIAINEESRAWDLTSGSHGFGDASHMKDLPTIDHATYLINGLKFHIGQLLHLFDEEEFMGHLTSFYANPSAHASANKIWFVQYLLILALSKTVISSYSRESYEFPGQKLFQRAINLLPGPSSLFDDTITAIELLCTIAIYLQAADMRNTAYIYVGQAIRMALAFGLHRECPTDYWSPPLVNRCRKVWWTVYILDRTFSVSLGVPISIPDKDITARIPERNDSTREAALYINVRLASLATEVVDKIYGIEGTLQNNFLPRVNEVLKSIAAIAGDLNQCTPLSPDGFDISISRVAAHLHLQYHQSVLNTLYPLLMYLFESRLQEGQESTRTQRAYSQTVNALLVTCAESCNRMIRILGILQNQELLETFLPFDLDRIFSASFSLSMLEFVDSSIDKDSALHSESDLVIQQLINTGCIPAKYRKSELDQLESLIYEWRKRHDRSVLSEADVQSSENAPASPPPLNRCRDGHRSDILQPNWLSGDQFLSLEQAANMESVYSGPFGLIDSWLWEAPEAHSDS